MFGKKKITVNIDFSTNQIIKIIAIIGAVYLVLKLIDVIILVFFSFIIMSTMRSFVEKLKKNFKIPRGLSMITALLIMLGVFTFFGYLISKPLSNEIRNLIDTFPKLVEDVSGNLPFFENLSEAEIGNNLQNAISSLGQNISSTLQNAVKFTFNVFNFFLDIITVIILSIYMLLERDKILNFIVRILGLNKKRFLRVYILVENQIGAWLRGQLILGLIIGLVTWIGLTILGIKYAIPLALIAGALELLPLLGPIISAAIVAVVAFSMNPITGLLSLLLAFIIQQLENNLLVPKIMQKAVGLSPVVTLLSIIIGSKLIGISGAILAIPLAAVFSVLIDNYINTTQDEIKYQN